MLLADDLTGLIASITTLTASLAVLVLIAGLVSGIVALGLMQTDIRRALQKKTFLKFFEPRYSEPIEPGGVRYLAIVRGPWLFGLHYRQLAGQLLALATSEAQRTSLYGGQGNLVKDILRLKEDIHEDIHPFPEERFEVNERLERAARWIDLLQGELGRAVASAVLQGTFWVWEAILVSVAAGSLMQSQSIKALLEARSFVQGAGGAFSTTVFVLVAVVSVTFLAFAVAATALFVFTLLDRIAGTR